MHTHTQNKPWKFDLSESLWKLQSQRRQTYSGEKVEAAGRGYGWGSEPAPGAQYTLRGGPCSLLKARPRPSIGLELSKGDMFCRPSCVCGSALVLKTNDKTAHSLEAVLGSAHQSPSADRALPGDVILAEASLKQGGALWAGLLQQVQPVLKTTGRLWWVYL